MRDDFRYYMDFDSDNRGLFGVYPFNVNKDRFNVWTLYTGDKIIDADEGNMVNSSRKHYSKCPQADYYAVLEKNSMGRNAFAIKNSLWVSDIHRKVKEDEGGKGLIHEFGHSFGGLKDEYHTENGPDQSGKPNCAPTRQKAKQWWGEMAEKNPEVGYERGCAYSKNNWDPHPGGTIMGDGGLWSYGPVNNRKLRKVLNNYE
jgi:hypothetical protein